MNHTAFDQLSKSLSAGGTRRGFVRLVAGLTLTDSLGSWLDGADAVDAARRRQRRKKRHKHKQGNEKEHRKGQRKGKAKSAKKHQRQGGAGRDKGTSMPPSSPAPTTPTPPPPSPQPPLPCVPKCSATNPCGDDGCGGSCGDCTGADTCLSGTCTCQPQCGGKSCGPDGCGGSCGQCAAHATCQAGSCICLPDCDGNTCGGDGCGGSCGGCAANETCQSGSCLCLPDCGPNVCGGDGCGGTCGRCVDQGAVTCGTTGACHGGDCERYPSGTACQAAICTGEATLRPACTCDGEGGCNCPAELTCPNDLVCRNGACLTSCGDNDDCDTGICRPNGTCSTFTCDCSTLNDCSGHGVCTETCACLCAGGWTGPSCSDPPLTRCGDYTSCTECKTHLSEGGTWCLSDGDAAVGVCSRTEVCGVPVETCPAGG